MEKFTTLTSRIIPLPQRDVDTDQIIPARYLKVTDKAGLADGLFDSWRYLPDGSPDPDFPLNRPEYRQAAILLAEDNFGCGSSREHAPWALLGWGIRAVISTSFADIFRSNALKNGLLPVAVPPDVLQELFRRAQAPSGVEATIDLAAQTLTVPGGFAGGPSAAFPIDPFSRTCMLEGLDPLGYLLKHQEQVEAYEKATGR